MEDNVNHGQIMRELGELGGTMKGMQNAMQIANGRTSKIEVRTEHIENEMDNQNVKLAQLDKDNEMIRMNFGSVMVNVNDFIKSQKAHMEEKQDIWANFWMDLLKWIITAIAGAFGYLLVWLFVNHKF